MNFTKKTLFWVIVLIGLAGTFYFVDEKDEDFFAKKEIINEIKFYIYFVQGSNFYVFGTFSQV